MERLHRSKRNKVILGVCGGLSEYLRIDVTLIRIISIVITIMGPGVILYLVAALIMPEDKGYTPDENQWRTGPGAGAYSSSYTNPGASAEPDTSFESEFSSDTENWDRPAKYHSEKNRYVLGAVLVGVGVLFLGKQFMPALFNLRFMIPLLLIVIGGIIVYQGRK